MKNNNQLKNEKKLNRTINTIEHESATWKKYAVISCDTSGNINDIISIIKKETDILEGMEEEEIEQFITSQWCEICKNGIIIWVDGNI